MEMSSREEGLDPLMVGKLRYRGQDYEGALTAFTEATNISTGTLLLTALDHRAATYEKLGKLQNALKDSKQMIDLKPEGAKGYLRCSKVLQLRGDTSLALRIYARGLAKVKSGTDPDRTQLEKLHKRLSALEAPKRNFNPLVMLPTELAQMVCGYLDACDRVACLRVHSSWKRFLEASYELWDTLDTTTVKRPITEHALKKHLQRSKYSLHSAIIRLIATDFNPKKMKLLTRTCQKLSYLEFRQGILGNSLLEALPLAKNLSTLIITKSAKITLRAVGKVFEICPNLIVAEFHNIDPGEWSFRSTWEATMHKLEKLILAATPKQKSEIGALSLHGLIEATPNLKVAHFPGWDAIYGRPPPQDFSHWKKLEELNLRSTQLERIIALPQSLKVLDVSRMWRLTELHCGREEQTDDFLPLLTSFGCTGTSFLTFDLAFSILESSIEAHRLTKIECGSMSAYDVNLFRSSESLTEICLSECQEPEDTILAILKKYPNLRRVDLSTTKVTGVTVKELMTKAGGALQWLNLNDCQSVSPDAVEYARSLGCHVERKFKTGTRSYRDMAA